jgi:hypothetical protein
MCVAVGGSTTCSSSGCVLSSDLERWNGRRWLEQAIPAPSGSAGVVLSSVACTSAKACTAVGFWGPQRCAPFPEKCGLPLMVRWNGSSWSKQRPPGYGNLGASLAAVSCPATRSCTAIGKEAERWNGKSWTIENLPSAGQSNSSGVSGLSCPTSRVCTAIEASRYGFRQVGSRWSRDQLAAPPLAHSYSLNGIACSSITSCFAVGAWFTGNGIGVPLIERWHKGRWSIQTV